MARKAVKGGQQMSVWVDYKGNLASSNHPDVRRSTMASRTIVRLYYTHDTAVTAAKSWKSPGYPMTTSASSRATATISTRRESPTPAATCPEPIPSSGLELARVQVLRQVPLSGVARVY